VSQRAHPEPRDVERTPPPDSHLVGHAQDGAPVFLPSGRMSASPLTLKLLDYVARGTSAEQLYVFRAAARVLGVPLNEEKVDAAWALAQCARACGTSGVPGRSVYRAWLEKEAVDWPSDYEVAKAFGGRWTSIRFELEAKPRADLRSLGLASPGKVPEAGELTNAIQLWHANEPDPMFRFGRFRAWAVERLCAGGEESATRSDLAFTVAISPNTYIKHFGSWLGALEEAGVLGDVSFDAFRRLAGSVHDYPDSQILDTVRDGAVWARQERGRELTRNLLAEYRLVVLRRSWTERTFIAVPAVCTIADRFGGSLTKAMLAAGVLSEDEGRARSSQSGVKLPDESLAAHVKVCARQLGLEDAAKLRKSAYLRWRNALVEILEEPVPAAITIVDRLGASCWPDAAAAAAAMATRHEIERRLSQKYEAALQPSTAGGRYD
jgi:hypothetical protein